jgi:transcriptional regulator with XRE-family HTH domain
MWTFGELLKQYMDRTGISDAELARTLGVRRQTIFRWKEGSVVRPRHAEDVLRCAQRLRLTAEERDQLLLAAGFPPQSPPALPERSATVTVEIEQEGAPPPRTPEPPGPSRGRARRLWLWVGLGILAAAAMAVLAVVWVRRTSIPVAREGETLLLVAPFANFAGGNQGYNVAGRVQDALAREIEAGRLSGVRSGVCRGGTRTVGRRVGDLGGV